MHAALFPTATTANAYGVKASQLRAVIDFALSLPMNGTNAGTGLASAAFPCTTWTLGFTHPTDGRVAIPVRQRLLTLWDAAYSRLVPAKITDAQYTAMRNTIVDGLATTLTADWIPPGLVP